MSWVRNTPRTLCNILRILRNTHGILRNTHRTLCKTPRTLLKTLRIFRNTPRILRNPPIILPNMPRTLHNTPGSSGRGRNFCLQKLLTRLAGLVYLGHEIWEDKKKHFSKRNLILHTSSDKAMKKQDGSKTRLSQADDRPTLRKNININRCCSILINDDQGVY